MSLALMPDTALFQFTPLREGRHIAGIKAKDTAQISIHAPAGGATVQKIGIFYMNSISIHAPAGGATLSGKML